MVADAAIILRSKLEKALKHLPCRNIKLKNLSISEQSIPAIVNINLLFPVEENSQMILVFEWDPEKKTIKNLIREILNQIPKNYLSITVKNIKESLQDIHYNFSNRNIPDSFDIIKLPYRQLEVATQFGKSFINLYASSYQKILSTLDENNSRKWKNCIDFSKIVNCMKRKELVTLLLVLNNLTGDVE